MTKKRQGQRWLSLTHPDRFPPEQPAPQNAQYPRAEDAQEMQRRALRYPRGSEGRKLYDFLAKAFLMMAAGIGKPRDDRRGRPKGTTGPNIDDTALLDRMAEIAADTGETRKRTLASEAMAGTHEPMKERASTIERLVRKYKPQPSLEK